MNLYLRLSDTELGFALYEPGRSGAFQFATRSLNAQLSLVANLREARMAAPFLAGPFGRVEVLADVAVTPVPLAEFQEEDAPALWHCCFSGGETDRVFYDTVPAVNVITVYGLPAATCQAIEEVFGPVRYRALLSAVMQHFAAKATGIASGRRVFVQLRPGLADVIIYEGSRLLLVNTYAVHALSDLDYYVLNVAQRLGADLTRTPIFVAGPPEPRDEAVNELSQYAARVYAVNPEADFNRHPVAMAPGVPYDLMCSLLK